MSAPAATSCRHATQGALVNILLLSNACEYCPLGAGRKTGLGHLRYKMVLELCRKQLGVNAFKTLWGLLLWVYPAQDKRV